MKQTLTMDHIVSTTVFMNDATEFAKMNAVYATFFKVAPPARTTVEVTRFPREGERSKLLRLRFAVGEGGRPTPPRVTAPPRSATPPYAARFFAPSSPWPSDPSRAFANSERAFE